jgi:hypothetical protein
VSTSEPREVAAGDDSRGRVGTDATGVSKAGRSDSRASCPHPEKVAHKSCGAALKARESLDEPADLALRPYRCVCGAWHLGHRGNRNPTVQLKRALMAGRKANRQARRRRKR